MSSVYEPLSNLGEEWARSGISVDKQDLLSIRWSPFVDSHSSIEGFYIAGTWKSIGRVRHRVGLFERDEGYQRCSGRFDLIGSSHGVIMLFTVRNLVVGQ